MISEKFIVLGALLQVVGGGSYIVGTLKGKTRPNRVTWLLWAIAPLIAFSAEERQGVGLPSLMTFVVGFNPLLILIASLVNRRSYWRLGPFDLVCGALSLLALVLWWVTRVGDVAIVLSILSDLFAGIPTVVKSYKDPASESYPVYLLGGVGAALTLLSLKSWTLGSFGFPVDIFLMNMVLSVLIISPRRPKAAAVATDV